MEDLLPFYLMIGVSREMFMDSDPVDLEPYDLMYRRKRNEENEMMHLQGVYFADALVATVGNMFRKKGTTPMEYPQEPYRIFPYTEEELEEKKEKELQKAIAYFNNMMAESKRKKKKKQQGG